jgi:release factor glutamine methyltransferase
VRREAGEPLAWILGWVDFCGRRLVVEPGVYVPRPQTEVLARRAAALGGRAADLCTGCGAVAAVVGGVGVDLDPRAVAVARRNGVRAAVGDLDGPLRTGAFDVVTAVAPYVPTSALRFVTADGEPMLALDGGEDGLDVVRRVVRGAARLLRPGGWFLTELGGDQDRALAGAMADFEAIEPWYDEDGDLRGVAARRR